MTPGRILVIIAIYFAASLGWMVLGASVSVRTDQRDYSGGEAVESLWGSEHVQSPPAAYLVVKEKIAEGKGKTRTVEHHVPLTLEGSDLKVALKSEPRRKGLLWYRTYKVAFDAVYRYRSPAKSAGYGAVEFAFPTGQAIYDGFHFKVNGRESAQASSVDQGLSQPLTLKAGEELKVEVAYRSQGLDRWSYRFGNNVSRINDFHLAMTTDFQDIDFPAQSLSPTTKQAAGSGWKLGWDYDSLISGFSIGMEMPQKLNPGPLAARMSFFAPVSLLFFFFMMFIIAVVKDIKLHPMHFLFLAAGFFSFHLLFAYLADHMLPLPAFLICTVVSVGLVVSYLRLVTGTRFALVEAGLCQLVYLVLFSYAFFFEGFTGLAITLLSIASLFLVMQLTGGMNWEKKLKAPKPRAPRRVAPAPPGTFAGLQ